MSSRCFSRRDPYLPRPTKLVSRSVQSLPTPSLVIDADKVRRNLRHLGEYARGHNLKLRPHTKTHKSIRLARMQLSEGGATGLTVAKAGEAQLMAQVSDDILVAYPVADPARAAMLAELARGVTVRVAVDSLTAAQVLADAAEHADSSIGLLVDIDVGLHRTGVQGPAAALKLAQEVDRLAGSVTVRGAAAGQFEAAPAGRGARRAPVRLDGLFYYPGFIWSRPDQQADALRGVDAVLEETLDLWHRSGLAAPIVSGGSTPSAYQSHLVTRGTEIRPGTYIFYDLNSVRGGYCTLEEVAATIECTVVSDAVPGQVVIDAGSKTLSSDRNAVAPDSGHGCILEFPRAKITKLTEEHGQVDVSLCDRSPKVGQRVTVIPNHICVCINLQDRVWWRESGQPAEALQVDARGRVI